MLNSLHYCHQTQGEAKHFLTFFSREKAIFGPIIVQLKICNV